jgi:hypothetical protein
MSNVACVRRTHDRAWRLADQATPFMCGDCHPPAAGLDVIWADGSRQHVEPDPFKSGYRLEAHPTARGAWRKLPTTT